MCAKPEYPDAFHTFADFSAIRIVILFVSEATGFLIIMKKTGIF